MTTAPPLRIAILGGGTAGWMTACVVARAWPSAAVTVIESPEIGIVGVGEGSTPQLAQLFADLGIADRDWMPRADATYKAGIEFVRWSDKPGFTRYFHPFANAVDLHTEPAFHHAAKLRRAGRGVDAHPDPYFLNSRLAAENRAPVAPEHWPFRTGYGYHFDAHKVGHVLRDHALGLGVRHLARKVVEVEVVGDHVAALVLDEGERVEADLFVDASGFRSVIAQGALGVRFVSFAENLFNDRAVVMPTPPGLAGPRPSTRATALSAGWAWDIPLTTRTGNGYVYSGRYIDPDDAERELRAHLGVGENVPARHLQMKVGRVETSWTGNCLAIGLAQGFVEPLEATALHVVQTTIETFVRTWADGGFTPRHRDAFNAAITARLEGIRDYIVAHYRLARRSDTEYWRDATAHDRLSGSLKAVMTCWFTGGDLPDEIARQDIARYYAPLSWGCLLAGYGVFPDVRTSGPELSDYREFLTRCTANFPLHADVLAELRAST
jgi:2-polyprenyl-6-methoxyphenol hydroxylase-like FAD-dependent oxidoreductase